MKTENANKWIDLLYTFPCTRAVWLDAEHREDRGLRSITELSLRSQRSGRVVMQSGIYECAHVRSEVSVTSIGEAVELQDIARLLLVLHAWASDCDCHRTDWKDRYGLPFTEQSDKSARHWATAFVKAYPHSSASVALREDSLPYWRIPPGERDEIAA